MDWRELGRQNRTEQEAAQEQSKRKLDVLHQQQAEQCLGVLREFSPEAMFTGINQQIWLGTGEIKTETGDVGMLLKHKHHDLSAPHYKPYIFDQSQPALNYDYENFDSLRFLDYTGWKKFKERQYLPPISYGSFGASTSLSVTWCTTGYHDIDDDRTAPHVTTNTLYDILSVIPSDRSFLVVLSTSHLPPDNTAFVYNPTIHTQSVSAIQRWFAEVIMIREEGQNYQRNYPKIQEDIRSVYRLFPHDPRVLADVQKFHVQV